MQLTVLIGIPGSGKSSYARRLGKPAINLDRIREQLYGDASVLGYGPEVLRVARGQLERLAAEGKDAVFDATHARPSSRMRTVRMGRELGYRRIVGVWLRTPLDECVRRNGKRERHVPEFVLKKMHNDLEAEPPSLAEGFDALRVVV